MKSALKSMMHIEMRAAKRCKKPCGTGVSCIGTRGADKRYRETFDGSPVRQMKQRGEISFPHIFTVRALDKLPGLFKPRRYLYHCARCKWSFIVNDGRRGALSPIADGIRPLSRDEAAARAATFAAGPCPAMRVVAEARLRLGGSNRQPAACADNPRRSELSSN